MDETAKMNDLLLAGNLLLNVNGKHAASSGSSTSSSSSKSSHSSSSAHAEKSRQLSEDAVPSFLKHVSIAGSDSARADSVQSPSKIQDTGATPMQVDPRQPSFQAINRIENGPASSGSSGPGSSTSSSESRELSTSHGGGSSGSGSDSREPSPADQPSPSPSTSTEAKAGSTGGGQQTSKKGAASSKKRTGSSTQSEQEKEMLAKFRKESHSALEQRRRDKINDGINQLKELVEPYSSNGKYDKASVLRKSIEYIQQSQALQRRLVEENFALREDNAQLQGCLEVIRTENRLLRVEITKLNPNLKHLEDAPLEGVRHNGAHGRHVPHPHPPAPPHPTATPRHAHPRARRAPPAFLPHPHHSHAHHAHAHAKAIGAALALAGLSVASGLPPPAPTVAAIPVVPQIAPAPRPAFDGPPPAPLAPPPGAAPLATQGGQSPR
eukprot:tig00001636_g9532.t1